MSLAEFEAWLRRTPKVELHVHLEGAVHPARLLAILRRHGTHPHLRRPEDVQFLFRPASFGEFLESFRFVVTSLRAVQDVHEVAGDLCADLVAQNVRYAEIIFSASIFTRMGLPLDELLAAVTEAADRACAGTGSRFNFVIDLVRNFGPDAAEALVHELARAAHPRVVGLHLGGDEQRFPARDFARAFAAGRDAGLGLAAHAGEADGPASVRDALEYLGVQRLGHGIRALEDPALTADLATRGVTLEVCPTSNVCTGVVPDLAAHPLPRLLAAGIPVTLGADDPAYFRTDLTGELRAVSRQFGLGVEVLEGFARTGLRAAFLPEAERRRRLEDWESARATARAHSPA